MLVLNNCGLNEENPGGPGLTVFGIHCIHLCVLLLICDSRVKKLQQEREGKPQSLSRSFPQAVSQDLAPSSRWWMQPHSKIQGMASGEGAGFQSPHAQLAGCSCAVNTLLIPTGLSCPFVCFKGILLELFSLQINGEVRETLRNSKPQLAAGCLGGKGGS